MATANIGPSKTDVGELLLRKMEDKGISIRVMAIKTGVVYEHVRRVVRGEGIPSEELLKLMCDVLGINYKDAEKLATADKMLRRYGVTSAEVAGRKPGLEPIERLWDSITESQRQDVIALVQSMSRNRAPK